MYKVVLAAMVMMSCTFQDSVDRVKQHEQERMLEEAHRQIGSPNIVNFEELRLLKLIYELRDQPHYSTYTYVWSDYNGKGNFLCNSVGYGMPYSAQFTNPERIPTYDDVYGVDRNFTIPQAEPNGIFMPDTAEATWIFCSNPKDRADIQPVYVEPRIIVSPFPLTDAPPS